MNLYDLIQFKNDRSHYDQIKQLKNAATSSSRDSSIGYATDFYSYYAIASII